METKEFKTPIPEGYEIDRENSTFECIKYKPIKKTMTYEYVASELFSLKNAWCIGDLSHIEGWLSHSDKDSIYPNICTSKKQAEKLLAINKLMNVAKYFNKRWKPNWNDADELKYFIFVSNKDSYIGVKTATSHICDIVYFKAEIYAKKAIEILGEDTIRTALSTDW